MDIDIRIKNEIYEHSDERVIFYSNRLLVAYNTGRVDELKTMISKLLKDPLSRGLKVGDIDISRVAQSSRASIQTIKIYFE